MNPETSRPDPDLLLARVQADEQMSKRGQLKIFLGYAAGVGKTYAMLEAAHQRMAEGVNVVIGVVETHNRLETQALVEGIESISLKEIEYKGITLTEMDVDAILARQPELALVDELAHTNAAGSRHPKRYQDVEELLDAGIDIYSTLNIQHLESLNDVVAQITGVQVRETIPDRVIDHANELELIDLPPDELLDRLREGKVYIPEQAQRAIERFFRKGNLTALREMTMRRAAERVDDQMLDYMRTRAIAGPWAAAERIIVCISPNPLGERLVRSARRLSDALDAEWQAVYIETPDHTTLSEARRVQVDRNLKLAEELGARTKIIPASKPVKAIAQAILDYARQQNVTKILVGKPIRPRWYETLRPSLVNELIEHSGQIDIHVITSSEPAHIPQEVNPLELHSPFSRYVWAAGLVLLTTLIGFFIQLAISPTNLVMLYLLAVVIASVFLGRGPSILVAVLSVAAFDFFFVPPTMTMSVEDTEYLITFAGLFLVSLVISAFTVRAQEQAEAAQRREKDTTVLYALSRDLAAAEDLDGIVRSLGTHISPDFGGDVVIYLPQGETLRAYPAPGNAATAADVAQAGMSVALWAHQHGEAAGQGTDTLPAASARYLPMKTSQHKVGVLSLKPVESVSRVLPEQRRLLEAFASQAAQAIERVLLAEKTRQMELLQAAEKLQNALLNSISHDLRSPLVTITGALTSLEEQGDSLDPSTRASLVVGAREEADRLNRLVGNLLDMTRLETGVLKIKREPWDVQDLVGAALGGLENRLTGYTVLVDIPPVMPLVELDFVLIVHVLTQLIDNALKYSSEGSTIEIKAQVGGNELQIQVLDQGIGIPEGELERIFDKFYRVQRPDRVAGTGLGLAISKGIIEAHGGRIWATNQEGGGATITFRVPV
jgi:two-component system sensor histidine kinase KdpD